MLRLFSIIYLIAIVFLGCENIYFAQNIKDIIALMAGLSLAFLCMVLFSGKMKGCLNFRVSALFPSLILLLLYSAISFYFSLNPDVSSYPAVKSISAVFLAIALLYYLKDIETLKNIFSIIFILAGIHACYGILQQFIPSLQHLPVKFSSASTSFFFNPNFFSGYLAVNIPIGIYLIIQCQNRIWKLAFAAILGAIYIALGFSGSPGGELIAIFQVLVVAIFLFNKKDFHDLKFLGWGLFLTLLVYVGLVKFLNQSPSPESIATTDSLIRRPWVWEHMENRFMYWSGAWTIFKENWVYGTGLWTFGELYPQTGFKYTPPHAHNMYIQTAVETGMVGLTFLLACIAVLFSTLSRLIKRGNPEEKNISFHIAVSLSGFLLHNLIEYNWLISNFIFYFVFMVVSVEVLNRNIHRHEESSFTQNIKKHWPKALTILLMLGAFTVMQYYRYNKVFTQDALASNTVDEMLTHFGRAKKICGRCAKPHYLSGNAYLDAFKRSNNTQYLKHAENEVEEAIRRNPKSLGAYLILGQIKNFQGNWVDAKKSFEKALNDSRYKLSALTALKNLKQSNDSEPH
jgi:O-antigen ligase